MTRDAWECPEDRFPIMGLGYGRMGEAKHTVPIALMLEHEQQALSNHGQSIARLKERGGLAWCELAAVLGDRRHWRMERDTAHEVAMRHVLVWQYRQRRAREATAAAETGAVGIGAADEPSQSPKETQ